MKKSLLKMKPESVIDKDMLHKIKGGEDPPLPPPPGGTILPPPPKP